MQEINKFNRNYYIQFEIGRLNVSATDNQEYLYPEETFTIGYPITIEFDVLRRIEGASNQASIRLYNLNKEHRNKLWKDERDLSRYIKLSLYAGYDTMSIPLIFTGRATYSYSYKKGGEVDWVTEIQANDIMDIYLYGYDSATYASGTEVRAIVAEALRKINVCDMGYISNQIPNINKNQTYTGNHLDLIKQEYPDFELFADLGQLNFIGKNEVIPSQLPVITKETGLLGTPQRRGIGLIADLVFEPRISLAQAVALNVESMPNLSGVYKLYEVKHKGIISATQGSTAITSIGCALNNNTIELKKEATQYSGAKTNKEGFMFPAKGQITSKFGKRIHPITKRESIHSGIDIGASYGSPIYATANGRVSLIQLLHALNGNNVQIEHGNYNGVNIASRYLHMSSIIVANNQSVTKGQIIGYVGSTGQSTAPHLHFIIYENGKPVNPENYVGNGR